ncbi:DUF6090 family protein [Robiginitalea aurantiaca]|uniref:DUF6090 family protein n=1 Tax=Robiginitalea aurantiaca TaxID=3056915 RepID=A0ABT7WFB6_9FLAO|nr:DUF6090 family protein [Robiginitalea aurantiaca]MDM9631615.1 DUF6090 family protein [Robiginitalea aurantiaca]
MITYFRKIRSRLLATNKTGKYIKYALGEIVLVVIGILIALQINDWNEDRKSRNIELKTLKELKADLLQTREDIKSDSSNFQHIIRSNQVILKHIEASLPYHDSLLPHFLWMEPFQTFSINRTTFDNIRQNGVNMISNDTIRISVSEFYTRPINLYLELEKRMLNEHYENYFRPMVMEAFGVNADNTLILNDYDGFIANGEYKQVLMHTVRICSQMCNFQGYLLKSLEEIIQQVNAEIQSF